MPPPTWLASNMSCSGALGVVPKMLIGLEGAHVFYLSIFSEVERLR